MKKSPWTLLAVAVVAAGCKAKNTTSTDVVPAASVATRPPSPSAAVVRDAPFEGEIKLAIYEPSTKTSHTTIAYDIKGDKVRAQAVGGDAGTARVVGDRGTKKVFAVFEGSKSFASVDVDTKAPLPSVTRTGKVEQVAGRACEDWTITDGGERFDLCVAKGIAYLDPAIGASAPTWAAVLTREHAFPLRVNATDKAGKQEFRAEATQIEARRLDDSWFNVPADYHAVPVGKTMKLASIP